MNEIWPSAYSLLLITDCHCQSCNSPGFDPGILRRSEISGAADEAVLNNVHEYFLSPLCFPSYPSCLSGFLTCLNRYLFTEPSFSPSFRTFPDCLASRSLSRSFLSVSLYSLIHFNCLHQCTFIIFKPFHTAVKWGLVSIKYKNSYWTCITVSQK